MRYQLLTILFVGLIFSSCGQEKDEVSVDASNDNTNSNAQISENNSTSLNLLVVDAAEDFSQTFELDVYTDKQLQQYEKDLINKYQFNQPLTEEMEKYNFRTLVLLSPGKVYDLSTKAPVTEGCFPILFDHLSGLIYSHENLETQYQHFKSTDLSIETPFSGTWCVDQQGVLSKFMNNSHVSLSGEGVHYFLNSYLFARGYFQDQEMLKSLFTAGLKFLENSEANTNDDLQLTKLPKPGAMDVDSIVARLNQKARQREALAPSGDPVYTRYKMHTPPPKDLESIEVVLGSDEYSLRQHNEFHVVSNGDRPVVIQGGPTCNPSACVNVLAHLPENALKTKSIEEMYHKLIDFDYSEVKLSGVEIDGAGNSKSINYDFDKDPSYSNQAVTVALNQMLKSNKALGKYRFEPRYIKDSESIGNKQIARILLDEFNQNDGRPIVIGTRVLKDGQLLGGHALTLTNIKEVDGDIWIKMFDSNGRTLVRKVEDKMHFEGKIEESKSHSSESHIVIRATPFHEFDLKGHYLILNKD